MMASSSAPPFEAHATATFEARVGGELMNDLLAFVDEQVRRGATRFLLAQKGEQLAIDEWLVPSMLDPHSLATGIYTRAAREATALRESVVYVLFAQRGSTQSGKFSLRIDGGPQWQSGGDTADKGDVVAMLIRHTEGTTRLSLSHSRDIVGHHEKLLSQAGSLYERLLGEAQRHLDKAHARIQQLEAREMEQHELRDQLRVMAGNLDVQRADVRRKDREVEYRHEERVKAIAQLEPVGRALLTMVAPGLASAVAAATAGPPKSPAAQSAAPSQVGDATASSPAASSDDLVDQLFLSLEQEQLVQIALLLRPQQQAILSSLYEGTSERMNRRRNAAAAPGAPIHAPPEEGAAAVDAAPTSAKKGSA